MKRTPLVWVTTLLLLLIGTACSLLPPRATSAKGPGPFGQIALLTEGWKSRELHIIDLDTDSPSPYSLGESTLRLGWVSTISCSSDGSKLALETDYYYSGHGEIQVLDADGAIHTLIPTGERLDATTGQITAFDLPAAGIDDEYSSNPGTLIDGRIFFINSSAAHWSPDGTEIAFQSMTFTHTELVGIAPVAYDIFVMEEDGANIRNLTNQQGDNRLIGWSTDGDQILFQSHPIESSPGDARTYVINADGSNRRPGTLPGTDADSACPTESADGAWRVSVSPGGDAQVSDVDQSSHYRLTDTSAGDSGPVADAVWLR